MIKKRVTEVKEMSEGLSKSFEKMDIKDLMKKMIDEMSEAEITKLMRGSADDRILRCSGEEKIFNLDLEENLRIKTKKSEKDSARMKLSEKESSVNSMDVPHLQILNIKKLDSSRS
jgi:hypothetical protein